MVMQGKCYSVMELAERVGVPRTTINDWLNRYSQYIDYMMQGKRRVYSENTLSVLLRISQLRSSGASSFQIEGELAASYAVHPETADEVPPPAETVQKTVQKEEGQQPEEVQTEPSSTVTEETPAAEEAPKSPESGEDLSAAAQEETALVRNPAEDPAVLLGERFREMLEKMDRMEKRSRSSARRAWIFFAFAAILTILVGIAGFFAHRRLRDMEKEASEKNAELARLTERAANLTAGAQSMREQLETLQSGLASQEKEFRAALQENRENYEKRREAELSAQKDRFAAERLELVRQMESAQRDAEEREAKLRKDNEETVRRLKEEKESALKRQAEALKKQAEEEKERALREKKDELELMKKEGEETPSVRKDREKTSAEKKRKKMKPESKPAKKEEKREEKKPAASAEK